MKRSDCDIKDYSLADSGLHRIRWSDQNMPVLGEIRKRFRREQPFAELRISACLQVTSETANLMRTLKIGGAEVVLCASNQFSTQDDVAASLVRDYEIRVYAIRGVYNNDFYRHMEAAVNHKPHIVIDDGGDLAVSLLTKQKEWFPNIMAVIEETSDGLNRMRALAKAGMLGCPVISANDSKAKRHFDNKYGTGQSTVDGIIRATDVLLAGKTVVIAGYGYGGRGFAERCRGMGANIIITEIDPVKALEAAMDGFRVMPLMEAAGQGDLFFTLTGTKNVIRAEHIERMHDGAILANSGHLDREIDIPGLEEIAMRVARGIRGHLVDEYTLKDGRRIILVAQGRLINLACAEGHPADVMDMNFATQALLTEYITSRDEPLAPRVYDPPTEVENMICQLKLDSLGIEIDTLTDEQVAYLSDWQEGT